MRRVGWHRDRERLAGWIYHVEGQFEGMDVQQRLAARDQLTRPLWKELHVWLKLERGRVPDGGSIAGAIDYSLNSWTAPHAAPRRRGGADR